MKKLILLFLISILLTGCQQSIELSSEEENILAEEMSNIIISHDERYQEQDTKANKVIDDKDNNAEDKEKATESVEKADDKVDSTNEDGSKADSENEIEKPLLESINQLSWDFSNDIKVELVSYDIVDNLPDSKDNYYYVGTADSSGNESILRLSFNVINHTDKEADFVTLDSDIEFYLKNENTVYYPLITFLPNDIQFMDIKLEAKDEQDMILLYNVPDDLDLDKVMFTIEDSSAKQS